MSAMDEDAYDVMEDESEVGDDGLADEEEILFQRTLVRLVEQTPPLYNNKLKEYSGKRFDKLQGWANVGAALCPPMTGEDAKKEFYKLRQRFGKELRKQRTWQTGKSGQQDKGPFVSNWPLFEDCIYLAHIITPKKTVSTYTSVPKSFNTVPIPKKSPSLCPSPVLSRPGSSASPVPSRPGSSASLVIRPASSPSPSFFSSPSPSPSSIWSSDGDLFMTDSETEATSSVQLCPAPQLPAPQQVLHAMQKAASSTKRTAPEPDTFAKRKKKQDDEFLKTMLTQSQALTDVAKQVGAALSPAATPAPAPPAPADPLLGTIKVALEAVPDNQKLQCIMDILTLITSKYHSK